MTKHRAFGSMLYLFLLILYNIQSIEEMHISQISCIEETDIFKVMHIEEMYILEQVYIEEMHFQRYNKLIRWR